jgi:hypothetical protein
MLLRVFLSASCAVILTTPVLTASACFAQTESRQAKFAGISSLKGSVPYSKANRNFTKLLTSLAQDKKIGLAPAAGAAEVHAWEGANLREDRVPFMRTAFRKALVAAGFTVQEISASDVSVNPYESFPTEGEDLAFHLASGKSAYYFAAKNESRSEALVGGWVPGDGMLALALLPVTFKAAAKPAALPDVKTGEGVVLVQDINETMKGVAPPKTPVFPPMTRKPNTVRGLVKDGAGRPIAGAQVAVYSSAGGGFRTTHKAVSNAQGLYEVLLPVGVGEIAEATCKVRYNDQIYDLPLRQVGGQPVTFSGKDGSVANFVLQTWGEYGAALRVLDNVDKGTIELTLTPQGKLLDGTAGRTFVYRYDSSTGSGENYLNGLPLGRYRLTARLLDDGEALPLRVGNTFGSEAERELKDSLQVDFKPGYTFSEYNRGKNNKSIQRFEVTLEP